MTALWHWALVTLFFVLFGAFNGVPLDVGWLGFSAFFGFIGATVWSDWQLLHDEADEESDS